MKKLLYLLMAVPFLALGQSTDQNYIKTTAYKVPTLNGVDVTGGGTVTDANKEINITYFDGLGRPVQQIAHRQSGTGTDIVKYIEYDLFGRQVKDYLPYATITSASLDYKTSALLNLGQFYELPANGATDYPYSQKDFEKSPLNRVLEQAAPGEPWAIDNIEKHTVRLEYMANATNEVKCYKAYAEWSLSSGFYTISLVNGTSSGYYDPNKLYKTITKNENWTSQSGKNNTVEEFKDKNGRVVLKRTYSDYTVNGITTPEVPHDTYYVHDQFGNLTYVLPPLVTNAATELDDLCYQYRYDKRNRLVEKNFQENNGSLSFMTNSTGL